jgi:hypothetical protein
MRRFARASDWHYDHRHTGDDDARNSSLWRGTEVQRATRINDDVGREGKERDADRLKRAPLHAFPAQRINVGIQPPQRGEAGPDFDDAVEAETDERDAAGGDPGDDRDESLDRVVRDRERGEALSCPDERTALVRTQ